MASSRCLDLLCAQDGVFAYKVNNLLTAFILPEEKAMIIAAEVTGDYNGLLDAKHRGVWLNEKQLYGLRELMENGSIDQLVGEACLTGTQQTAFLDPGNKILTDVIFTFHPQFGRRVQLYQHQRQSLCYVTPKTVSLGYRAFSCLYQELERRVFTLP
jgi:hypothetical protein